MFVISNAFFISVVNFRAKNDVEIRSDILLAGIWSAPIVETSDVRDEKYLLFSEF